MMRVLVCGGRNYSDKDSVFLTLAALMVFPSPGIDTIIHGGARGADAMAAQFAEANELNESVFPADWSKYGRRAGPIRNQQMITEGRPDLVVAFPGGRGTNDMIHRARKAGIKVLVVPG